MIEQWAKLIHDHVANNHLRLLFNLVFFLLYALSIWHFIKIKLQYINGIACIVSEFSQLCTHALVFIVHARATFFIM